MSGQQFRFDGKRALIVGGATGMGAAAAKVVADLGATTVVMDRADIDYPVDQAIQVDLSSHASVDGALEQLNEPFDAVFSCAGVADGVPAIMLINFISQRYIVEQLLARGLLNRGCGVTMISSAAGLAWMQNMPQIMDFLSLSEWQAAADWVAGHEGTNSYMFSKQAMCAYVANQCFSLLKQGVRINSVMPGPTDTPLARANPDVWLGFGAEYRKAAGVNALTPEQIGNTMVFLCSEAASGVTGINLIVDSGHISAGTSGAYDDPHLKMLG